jgi:hypothetical protein
VGGDRVVGVVHDEWGRPHLEIHRLTRNAAHASPTMHQQEPLPPERTSPPG